MSRYVTITEIKARHQREIKRLVLGALVRNTWRLAGAARDLEVEVSSLQRLIETHGLVDDYAEHRHGRGRPKVTPP